MAITVYEVKSHHAGFGMYERGIEGESFDDLSDYIDACRDNGCELIEEDEPEYEQVRNADGSTYNQNSGKIVGFRDRDGYVLLACIIEG